MPNSTFEVASGGIVLERQAGRPTRVLVVRRGTHGDWSLPKGKFELGRDRDVTTCAVREVMEETGVSARVVRFAGQTTYAKNGHPKMVLFWEMTPDSHSPFSPSAEIAGIAWLTVAEALERLTYPDERRVLRETAAG